MNYKLLYQWEEVLAAHLPALNGWQRANVALFSYGIMEAGSCQQEAIARQINGAETLDSTMRRWRRFLSNSALAVERVSEQWASWVLSAIGTKQVTLLVDETKVHDRIAAMVVGVAWEGRCIPLVWRVYPANNAAGYPPEGQVKMIEGLLQRIQKNLKQPLEVLLLADRGIGTSPDLCRAVEALGWHYLFRVTCQTKVVTDEADYTIAQQVQAGEIWAMSGQIFKQRGRIPAHARALWEMGYDEPWALVTNDECLTGHEYARRNWQEQCFRDLKSGGWQWGVSRIRLPDHADRLLLLLALAYGWVLALGSQAVSLGYGRALIQRQDGSWRRQLSLFKEGLRFFVDYVRRFSVCLGLTFIPDTRFIQ
jgi:hypothetical protein